MGGGPLCRLPFIVSLATDHWPLRLRGLAGTLAFESLFRAAADVDLDLLRLGFGLLGQRDLQHALVVVRRNMLGVHGLGQSEGAGETAVLSLHSAVVLFFLFLLDLAL